jgi:hypothetical protein
VREKKREWGISGFGCVILFVYASVLKRRRKRERREYVL